MLIMHHFQVALNFLFVLIVFKVMTRRASGQIFSLAWAHIEIVTVII
jgi:hypothetical protein